METKRTFLKDYQAPNFDVVSVEMDFNLNDEACLIVTKTKYRRLSPGPLELNGEQLDLLGLRLNGEDLPPSRYQKTDSHLIIPEVPETFELEVTVRQKPQDNTALEGLYRSNDCFVTQCEAQGFRRITYFMDRPDVMTLFKVRIEADVKKYPVLLSNGDRKSSKALPNGRHEVHWQDPFKKPCYLFALVAGNLDVLRDQFTTSSGRTVNLEVYAAFGKKNRCGHAMESLKKAMKWDEETFGREYDLNDYMIVAIDDFNAGAMENKGLNIFNSRLVLADANTATDSDFAAIESVVAHEYFHNWTGNRVTLRDWFQLSLKEGLTVFRDQEFSGDMTDRGVQRIQDVDSLRERQFPEDAGPNAHPVRPESCMAVDNFFTPTIYEKGAELIRMMQTTVGRTGFRRGMDLYFERHDGQAVTTEDFAAAIADANKSDFSQLKNWYHQSGTPTVTVQENWNPERSEYQIKLTQSCKPTQGLTEPKPFQIPVLCALLAEDGRELPLRCPKLRLNSEMAPLLELKTFEETYSFAGLPKKPVASLFREFSAPVNVEWQRPDQDLFFLMAKDNDGFNRREAAQEAGKRVLSALISALRTGATPVVNPGYVRAWGEALRSEIDPAYHALLLSLPSDSVMAQNENVFSAGEFRQARKILMDKLGQEFRADLLKIYRQYHGVRAQHVDAKTAGHRALKNLCLWILNLASDAEAPIIAWEQFAKAQNMTDRLSAFAMLVDSEDPRRAQAISTFHKDWRSDSVVLNKWFTVQAQAVRHDTFQQVQELTKHPDFQISNPNNVYSLLRSFGNNLTMFHDEKNPAYTFYADKIIEIDSKNPQVAARLCAAFNILKKLSPTAQGLALKEIRRIVAVPTLSKNTRELLEPSLR